MVKILRGILKIVFYFANFSKCWWFQTKQLARLLEFIKLYNQNPSEKFFIFTIYQNYTILYYTILWLYFYFHLLLSYVYKSLHNQAPSYIADCLTVYTPNRNLRSSSDNLQLKYPLTRTQAGDRTFTVAASKEWNTLPLYISENQSRWIHLRRLWKHICFHR